MKSILKYLPEVWHKKISEQWSKDQMIQWQQKIQNCLTLENTTPAITNIFKAFELCDPDKIKVIIIGQDPYPTEGHAHGLAFSTDDFVKPFPRSLGNIFKELKRSIPDYETPVTGNLTSWAAQGVFLINNCLTTEKGIANAHKNKGWEEFTDLILKIINQSNENLVVFFWGKKAFEKKKLFTTENHCLLSTSHPSPLSVRHGFDGCNHFVECNFFLKSKKIPEINWQS